MNSLNENIIVRFDSPFEMGERENKSILHMGNCHIYNTKKFNKLNKFMFKVFFGIEIKDIRSD